MDHRVKYCQELHAIEDKGATFHIICDLLDACQQIGDKKVDLCHKLLLHATRDLGWIKTRATLPVTLVIN